MSVPPPISVVMPVYNAERFLAEAVESIRAQTFSDFELIAIDDGSTDSTLKILKGFAAADPRVRLVSRANTGIVGALNEGLALARGEFIARMDADDRCQPRRFELQLQRMHSEPGLVALGSCAVAIDPEGRRLGPAPVPLTHEAIEGCHLEGTSSIYHPAVMMRAAAVRQVGGYRDFCPVEDFDLWLRLGEVGRLANLPEELLVWRRTISGLVATQASKRWRMLEQVLEDVWRRRGLPGRPDLGEPQAISRGERFRQWAWMAHDASELATFRIYALKAIQAEPWALANLRLLRGLASAWRH